MSNNILCFTITYNRPYFIYNTINNILNQSYSNFIYSVRINIDEPSEKQEYEKLLSDFSDDSRLNIIYGNNLSQQKNYISSITAFDNNHNVFIKIDDDDIYHKKYLENSIDLFNKSNVDILSYSANSHINNKKIYGKMNSIGNWRGDSNKEIQFGMPPTYIFNRKAFDLIKDLTDNDIKKIHTFEDAAWRTVWRNNNIKSYVCNDKNIFTYNIHGDNISSKFLFDKDAPNTEIFIDNKYTAIYYFKHKDWQSYIYLNKRNNRAYNINNDDHGSFKFINSDKIQIKWDLWNEETFQKNNNHFKKILN